MNEWMNIDCFSYLNKWYIDLIDYIHWVHSYLYLSSLGNCFRMWTSHWCWPHWCWKIDSVSEMEKRKIETHIRSSWIECYYWLLCSDRGLTPKIPENCPPKLREVMQMCWNQDPNQRPVSSSHSSFLILITLFVQILTYTSIQASIHTLHTHNSFSTILRVLLE
jgi:hypothetical protein